MIYLGFDYEYNTVPVIRKMKNKMVLLIACLSQILMGENLTWAWLKREEVIKEM